MEFSTVWTDECILQTALCGLMEFCNVWTDECGLQTALCGLWSLALCGLSSVYCRLDCVDCAV